MSVATATGSETDDGAAGAPASTGSGAGSTGAGGAGVGGAGAGSAAAKPSADAGKGAPAAGDGAKGYWPEDWREKVAGEDAKLKERLGRYATPADVSKALIAAQNKISSGELKPTLGKNASKEEVAAWREANGIPPEATKYDTSKFEVSEDDRPLIDKFLAKAHAANMTQDQAQAALGAYFELTEEAQAGRTAKDEQTRTAAEDVLRTEWGSEFRANVNRATQLLDRVMDQETKGKFANARFADGVPILNDPGVLKALVQLALVENPAGTLVPSGAGPNGLGDEIAKIEKFMATNRNSYNKDEKMQERYRELLDAREKLASRKAA